MVTIKPKFLEIKQLMEKGKYNILDFILYKEKIIKTKIIQCFEKKYPSKLLQIREYPRHLYCVGDTGLLNHEKIIAIVGSRNCSEYGRKYARLFGAELAKNNICVISGLALGIDTAAHFGAMSKLGKTIAVLGGGLNDIYPKENQWLFNQILQEKGCIITEHRDEEITRKENFPKRNRIISGIADAVLVVEASKRSGSRITARYAKIQGKGVFCIPSSLDNKNIAGIKDLIEDGAKIVTSANQLISEVYETEPKNVEKKNLKTLEKDNKKQVLIHNIPSEYQEVYNILQATITKEEIAIKLNKGMDEINAILTMMEVNGYIEQIGGNNFKRRYV